MVRLVHQRFAVRPVTMVTAIAFAFGAMMLVTQAGTVAAQATATRPVGTAIATTAATRAQGVGTAVATRAATTAPRPAATGTGGGAAATAPRPAATAPRPAATAPRPAATATRPAPAAPAAMPRTGGGGMASSFVDEGTAPNRSMAFGLAGLAGIVGAGAVYARRLRRS